MKWSELERIAIEKGWVFQRRGRKHDAYTHPEREDVLWLERHPAQEIRKGLYNKLKKQVGF